MTIPNSAYQTFGKLSLPISEDDITDSFSVLDPVRDRLLALFTAAVNDEFGSAWTTVTATLPTGSKLIGTSPVQDSHPGEPTQSLMTTRKAGFPLLCLHRTGEPVFEQYLMDQDKLTSQWHMHWILGPLDLEEQRKLLDLGQAIGKLVKMVERDFGHRSYESGANQFESATGGLMSLRLLTHTQPGAAGFADDDQNLTYWAVRYTLETTELVTDLTDHEADLEGLDFSADVGGANEADISPDFVQASTDPVYQKP